MRIVAISDTHGFEPELPEGDILIHAGDMCNQGTLNELAKSAKYLNKQREKFAEIIIVPGNHDIPFQTDYYRAVSLFNAAVLTDKMYDIKGLCIFGTSWQPEFMNWAFNAPDTHLQEVYRRIPQDIDILVTHCPPYGMLDTATLSSPHVGSKVLLEHVTRIQPNIHIFGHIHGSYGKTQDDLTTFYNVAICDENYEPVHSPTVIDLNW